MTVLTTATEPPKNESSWSGSLQNLVNAISQVAPIAVSAQVQKDVMKTNIELQKNGLEPLDLEQYSAGFKLGLDKTTQTTLIVGGLILAGTVAFIYTRKGKK